MEMFSRLFQARFWLMIAAIVLAGLFIVEILHGALVMTNVLEVPGSSEHPILQEMSRQGGPKNIDDRVKIGNVQRDLGRAFLHAGRWRLIAAGVGLLICLDVFLIHSYHTDSGARWPFATYLFVLCTLILSVIIVGWAAYSLISGNNWPLP